MAQLFAIINDIKNEINEKASRMENKIDGMTQILRGETRQVGQCLQADKMAPPRATTSELKGSAPAGEDRVSRETCWARRVEVTETVTQTLKGEETTWTRDTRRQVTELTETREAVEERLHGGDVVKDTHTHTGSEGQWGRARRACWDPV